MAAAIKINSFLIGLTVAATGALAQDPATVLSGVSPIPEGAKNDYCYYGGLAYSPNSYLPVSFPTQEKLSVSGTSSQTVEAKGSNVRVILLQCVDAEAVGRNECSSGGMAWAVRQNVAVSPRIER